MSTYARSTTPLDLVIGRPFSLALAYTDPSSGTAINTTGMTIDTALTWLGQDMPVLPSIIDRNDAAGAARLTLQAADTASVPAGLISCLRVTYTDSAGDTADFEFPCNGECALGGALT